MSAALVKKYETKQTFCITGKDIKIYKELLKREACFGNSISLLQINVSIFLYFVKN